VRSRAAGLQADLDRDLDGDRARVGEEDVLEPGGVISTSRRASSIAGSCVSPPNITCDIVPSCATAAASSAG
jgi:hypothetical protein